MKVHPYSNPPNLEYIQQQKWRKVCICLVLIISILVVLATGVALIILDRRIHLTIIEIPKVEINSLTVSNFNISSGPDQISANWNVKMNLESRDKHGYLNFSGITVSIYYDVLQVGLTTLMPFDITPHNSTKNFDEEFLGSSRFNHDSIISDISKGITVGTITFDVQFEASVRKSFKGRWVGHLWLVIDCKKVELFFGSSDKSRAQMLNSSHKCKVNQPSNY